MKVYNSPPDRAGLSSSKHSRMILQNHILIWFRTLLFQIWIILESRLGSCIRVESIDGYEYDKTIWLKECFVWKYKSEQTVIYDYLRE